MERFGRPPVIGQLPPFKDDLQIGDKSGFTEPLMDNQKIVLHWHIKIIRICEARLQRMLSNEEREFVRRRGAFVALEMIEDSVSTMPTAELVGYLNSEIDN